MDVNGGMDSEANPHDLSNPLIVLTRCAKVAKVNENLVWFRHISYPFKIPTFERLELNEDIYGHLVQVENEWYIREFSYEPAQRVYGRNLMIEHKHLMISADFIRRVFATSWYETWMTRLIEDLEMTPLTEPKAVRDKTPGNEGITAFSIITTSHLVLHLGNYNAL